MATWIERISRRVTFYQDLAEKQMTEHAEMLLKHRVPLSDDMLLVANLPIEARENIAEQVWKRRGKTQMKSPLLFST